MATDKEIKCYIGIGSNLAGPLEQVQAVIPQLDAIPNTRLVNQSSLYESEAVSDIEQEDFINAVACIKTLQTGILPPTINLENQDPECDVDVVANQARDEGEGQNLKQRSDDFVDGIHGGGIA